MSEPSILLQARQIEARVAQVAKEIDKHYSGDEFVVLVVLKGAMVFAADLMRQIRTPFQLEFAQSRTYGDSTSPQNTPAVIGPDLEKISDKHILLVDDILDTGATYLALKSWLLEREALSVRGCFLLDKPWHRDPAIKPDFFGFQVPDVFVVGYGLDHAERFRNLPYIAQLPESVA